MDLRDAKLYFNRELSWLRFNQRVLQEAHDTQNPLLERVKFLGIVANNLDEFFEVRLAGLLQQVEAGLSDYGPDGMLPEEQISAIAEEARRMVNEQYACWNEELLPALRDADVHIGAIDTLSDRENAFLDDYCHQELHPVLTPLTINPAHPLPRLINKALCIAVLLKNREGEIFPGVVQVPRLLPRLIRLPREEDSHRIDFVLLADLIQAHIPELFRGYQILDSAAFRITRNSDLYLHEEETDDLLLAIEDELQNRRKGDTVRLEIEADARTPLVKRLQSIYSLKNNQVYIVNGPVNLNRLMGLYSATPRPDLKYPPYHPTDLTYEEIDTLFDQIKQKDMLLHHPYDAFTPVVQFVNSAATDSSVLAIKQTLYRTNEDSPIIEALIRAAEAGKEVTVVVELKARFDEESNIRWARRLQDAGVCVVYGVVGLKTHCKLSMIIRREPNNGLRRYAHIGTGNYNPSTARLYTDIGLFTAREDITNEVAEIFNLLTTQSAHPQVKKLLVAPHTMLDAILQKIDREIGHVREGRTGRIVAKMNALQDPKVIRALYLASQGGVQIDLIVRGICCLRPGIPGVSDNIRVRSIIGRFLEHSRVYYFENGGDAEIYIGSADWMPRNLRRRVEILCPIEDPDLIARVRSELLSICMADNVKTREILPDGTDRRIETAPGEPPFCMHDKLMSLSLGESTD
ncbi:MAG: polyphosphate kinase 1, partial [Candidatus Latescibacteria bacterium]|nr:polyphosphate kinase 1 [Candidatus Latescibacterota bacterium]